VDKEKILDGRKIRAGDVLLGLASSGLHTNGYTLARRIVFDVMGLGTDDEMPGTGRSVGDELLAVHRSYLSVLWPLLQDERIHGLAHITGGGIPGNLPRVLPVGLGAVVDRGAWPVPAVFRTLQERGGVDRFEMDRVFNMGVGMIAVVRSGEAATVASAVTAHGIDVWTLGTVEWGSGVRYVG
jgi:phosphoribosylformylglycinamidine cyclo-ligase